MIQQNNDGGIFTRNHRTYLETAADIARRYPSQLVTLRSKTRWRTASNLLKSSGQIPIYFAVVDEGPMIQFRAWLREVRLQPQQGDSETETLLNLGVAPADERLWDGRVETLYVISGCYELEKPFPMMQLKKLNGGEPIDENYGYSYIPVIAYEADLTIISSVVASDVSEPSARTQVLVNRIIRDTAIVRRLKRLHDDCCQRCGLRLTLDDGSAYSEGHHLQPLGSPHDGPDIPENLIVVCPNCHALLDLCGVSLERNGLRLHPEHQIAEQYVRYHNGLRNYRAA
jgi:hypothetical protein